MSLISEYEVLLLPSQGGKREKTVHLIIAWTTLGDVFQNFPVPHFLRTGNHIIKLKGGLYCSSTRILLALHFLIFLVSLTQ